MKLQATVFSLVEEEKLEITTRYKPVLKTEAGFSSQALDIIGLSVFNYDFGSVTKESPVIKAIYGTLFEAMHRSTFYFPFISSHLIQPGKTEEVKDTMAKSNRREVTPVMEIAKKAVVREDASNMNGSKIERDATEEGERSRETVKKAIAKESVEGNKTSLGIAENVNLWEYSTSKDRTYSREAAGISKEEEKKARRVTNVEAIKRAKEEVSSLEQGKSIKTEEYQTSPQEGAIGAEWLKVLNGHCEGSTGRSVCGFYSHVGGILG